MFEERDFDWCLAALLSRVPSDVSKEEGSVVYTALAPVAFELERLYIEMDEVLTQTFADTADYDFLKLRAAERGMYPVAATFAKVRGRFNCEIPEGSTFGCGSYTYVSSALLEAGDGHFDYELVCEDDGTGPNGVMGELEDMDGIDDFETGYIAEILVPGKEEEDVEDFRARYLASFDNEAFGGNVSDYMEKVKSIEGVGACHVYPVWNGGGTVKVEILDSAFHTASDELVNTVQETMCPDPEKGYGLSPIGHDCTVVSAEEVPVDIETTLTFGAGISYADVEDEILSSLESYLLSLRKNWEAVFTVAGESLVTRIAVIEATFLSTGDVIDVADTKVCGVHSNLDLTVHQVPVLGSVTVHDASA